ncbi:MAG: BtpA/SgcQ family protein [Planctomycetota bacterium]
MQFEQIFGRTKPLIGMVHVWPLPGTARYDIGIEGIAQQAAAEAKLLEDAGFDALIVENMHDAPYLWGKLGPEITAAMTRVALEVRSVVGLPIGVQVLSGGHREALASAVCGAGDFIRCENYVYAHVADEGLASEAAAGELLRYRRQIDAERIGVFADIKKKHASHTITDDVSISEAAETAAFFGADALVVTGRATGQPTDLADVKAAKNASGLPVVIGSGLRPENAAGVMEAADGAIAGSWYKQNGDWRQPPDPRRLSELMRAIDRVRLTA